MRKIPVPAAVHERIIGILYDCAELAYKKYGKKIDVPMVTYETTGRVAGRARYLTWQMDLNSGLLMRNLETFNETVTHEMAHLITYKIYPETLIKKPGEKREVHGPRFYEVWEAIGGTRLTRRHSYDTTETRKATDQSKFEYKCPAGHVHQLSARRHQKAVRAVNGFHYMCAKCPTGADGLHPRVKFTGDAKLAPTAHSQTVTLKAPTEGTKIYACWEVYKSLRQVANRKSMIRLFVNRCECTPAGAGTYYATCLKLWEAGVR